ncbi:MAG: NAD-dependent epimerase/dehydratase family protein [Geminicoccaceae bacterium]
MPRTIAVTGASGFIGRRLIERLCRDGNNVRALQRHRPINVDVPIKQLRTVKGSLDDQASLQELVAGVDTVIHLAGLIKARQRKDFFGANATGVARLVEAMMEHQDTAKLILISSLAAREPGLSSYAASKRCGEAVLLGVGEALPWTVLRPPAVYGQGDRETLAFFKGIQRGIGAMLGSDQARFSLIHVDDLTDAMAHVVDVGNADHLLLELDDGAEGGYSWPSMIDAGERALNVSTKRITVPPMVLTALGHINSALRILPGYTPMLTPEKAKEITHPNWVADSHLIMEAIGWRPTISIDSGFRATVDWYRLHRWL